MDTVKLQYHDLDASQSDNKGLCFPLQCTVIQKGKNSLVELSLVKHVCSEIASYFLWPLPMPAEKVCKF